MAYYMVHACNKRMWYVKDFLLPSMVEQGIDPNHIFVYVDKNNIGNLRAWVDSCNRIVWQSRKNGIEGVWHLQDDVVISKDFKMQTELYDNGLICGFTCKYNDTPKDGTFMIYDRQLWYSFPCIRIPTHVLELFTNWANLNLWQSNYFKLHVRRNNADDLIFREWLYDNIPNMEETNLNPNLVNHIDKWLGGSTCNQQRDTDQDTMSMFWEDRGELEEVWEKLQRRDKT